MISVSEFNWNDLEFSVWHDDTDGTIDSAFHEIYELGIYHSDHCSITPGDVVVDGGAHYGLFSIYAALLGAAELICFEPDPKTCSALQSNIERNRGAFAVDLPIAYYNRALWDSESIIEFRPAKEASAGSRVVLPGLRKRPNDVFVETMALDSLDLPRVDVVKLDIEGCELQALLGMEKTIKRFRPKLMVSIYHHHGDPVRLPKLIESYGMNYKYEVSSAAGKHITGFFY